MIADRLLVALATLRPTARELGDLRRFLYDRSASEALKAIHQIEDYIDDGRIEFKVENDDDQLSIELEIEQRIKQIYQQELRVSGPVFVGMVMEIAINQGIDLPKFETKRGVRYWISQSLKRIPPSDFLRLATIVKDRNDLDDRSWRLK